MTDQTAPTLTKEQKIADLKLQARKIMIQQNKASQRLNARLYGQLERQLDSLYREIDQLEGRR